MCKEIDIEPWECKDIYAALSFRFSIAHRELFPRSDGLL